MRTIYSHPLTLSLLAALLTPSAGAASENQELSCKAAYPLHIDPADPAKKADRALAETLIDADNVDISDPDQTKLSGNVTLTHGDQKLSTEQLSYDHSNERAASDTDTAYEDGSMRFQAKRFRSDFANDSLELEQVQYQLRKPQMGNGEADSVRSVGDIGTLSNATFSTCPPGQRQWAFEADEIEIDQAEGKAVARNAVLRLGSVPVVWLPWVSFPINEQRSSGLLSPKLGYNERNGFDIELPFYLNLAPNYDATLSPRWISKRGVAMGAEFRYLSAQGQHAGEISGSWIGDDRITGQDRGVGRWRHHSGLDANWQLRADIQHVSDPAYFQDFGNQIESSALSLLSSEAGIYGLGNNWRVSLSGQQWDIANPSILPGQEPFRRMPRLLSRWHSEFAQNWEFGIRVEAVRFTHDLNPGGERIDLQPYVSADWGGNWWYLRPRVAFRHTQYQLEPGAVPPGFSLDPQRSTPISSADFGLFFEREGSWREHGFIQTLEPRLFYLNVPYRDQDDLPLFDTQTLSFSWPSLFRQNRYSGADRQTDADQLTLTLRTRFIEQASGLERLSLGLGRVHYFEPPRVSLPSDPITGDNGSYYVFEANSQLSNRWSLGYAYQFDEFGSETALSAVRSQWRLDNNGVINLAYRYRRDLIEQADASFVYPVSQSWRWLARWNYSIRDHETFEALAGLEWKSCCMAFRAVARRYIPAPGQNPDLGIYLEIELNGIGRFGRDADSLLGNAILGYSP